MPTPPSASPDHRLPLFQPPTIADVKDAAEHLAEHKPEMRNLNNWSLTYMLISGLSFGAMFWRPLMVLPYLFAITGTMYYVGKADRLRRHCLAIALSIDLMAEHLGMSERQLKEIFDGLRHAETSATKQPD